MSFESVECTPCAIFEVPVLHSLYAVLFLWSCLVIFCREYLGLVHEFVKTLGKISERYISLVG